MAQVIDLSDDDGFVVINFGDGGEARLDLYQAYSRLLDIYQTHAPKDGSDATSDGALLKAQRAYLEGAGLKPGSDRQVVRFADAVFQSVEKKRSADAGAVATASRPAAPASTQDSASTTTLQN